ncbi:MAG: putative amidohydrolase YtcJ [Candidatus Krumholzibacteriia bacterium]|jgi:predicted amidohydrolase YtcJ
MIRICISFVVILAMTGCTSSAPTADLILTGGHVMSGSNPTATAIAVKGNRIMAVGSDEDIAELLGADTKVVPLDGAYVSPGFNDSHAHLMGLGASLSRVDLVGTTSPDAILALVQAANAELSQGLWLRGGGWDQNDWSVQEYPTAQMLDTVTSERPIILRRIDGHASWVNSAALAAAGITRDTLDPAGGEIVRDAEGNPTGILIDNAVSLVGAIIPETSMAELERRLDLAIAHCWANGLTGMHDAGVDWTTAQIYERRAAANDLNFRIYGMYSSDETTLANGLQRGPFTSADSLLSFRAIKIYGDGALGSRGALLLEDYTDQPGHRGLPVTSAADMKDIIVRGAAAGFQLCTHAIGDGGNRLVLDLYENELIKSESQDQRWRVEHAQILDPVDIPRFGELGVIASMQPTHCTSDMDWASTRLGDDRLAGAYAWRSLLDSGAKLCFGTDFPVERVNPFHGLYSARTRTHHDGAPQGGWRAQEALTGAEAHELYTAGSAYASFQEDKLGRLEPGFWADLTVLNGDPANCAAADLLTMQAVHTVVAGQLVYSR